MNFYNSTPRVPNFSETNVTRWLVSIWISLGMSFVAAEVLGTNRFLRTWLQAYGWVYIVSYLMVLGMFLSGSILVFPKMQKLAAGKMLIFGVGVGLLSSLVALSISPSVVGKGLAPSLKAWRDPVWWVIASGLSLGWLYGGSVTFMSHSLVKRRYWGLAYLFLACAGIKILELVLNLIVGAKS